MVDPELRNIHIYLSIYTAKSSPRSVSSLQRSIDGVKGRN